MCSAVRKGEKGILTQQGKPLAARVPVEEGEIERLVLEGRGGCQLAASAFAFGDTESDEVWNKV